MASREPEKIGMWGAALTVAMVFATLVLLAGAKLQEWLGEAAMHAIERLLGLILTAVAVEMLLAGIKTFVEGLGARHSPGKTTRPPTISTATTTSTTRSRPDRRTT
jgi:predicted tellurium resistance membrane protein TerC